MIKNKEKRVCKMKGRALLFFAFMFMAVPAMLTSCQTPVYTLNNGTYDAIEDFTPAEKAEWKKNVTMSLNSAHDAQSNRAYLDAIDISDEMPLTMRNHNVDMAMNREFFKKYQDECSWCYKYMKDLFAVIAPEVVVNLKVVGNEMDENTFFGPHIIAYSEQNYEDSDFSGSTNKHLDVDRNNKNLAVISTNVMMNSKYDEKFQEESSYFKKAMLHETLHAFGLNHLENEAGGNIMAEDCSDSVYPLALSPAEMEKMISLYSTRSESFLNVFMNWYRRQYDNCLQYSIEHLDEYAEADKETRSEMVESNTIDCRQFFEIYKQYQQTKSANFRLEPTFSDLLLGIYRRSWPAGYNPY